MTFKPKAMKIADGLASVNWSCLPAGTKFSYLHNRLNNLRHYVVRHKRSDGSLWVTRPGASTRGLVLTPDGVVRMGGIRDVEVGAIAPETVVLPANTPKALRDGADFSWLIAGTLIADGYGIWRCITGNDGGRIYVLRCDFGKTNDTITNVVGLVGPALQHELLDTGNGRRAKRDLFTETAVLPMFGQIGEDVWQFTAGIVTPPSRPLASAFDSDNFLSWDAVL